jgi:hypothetical protein
MGIADFNEWNAVKVNCGFPELPDAADDRKFNI